MENVLGNSDLGDKNLSTLTHQEHREIVILSIVVLHVLKNGRESLLILLVDYGFRTISRKINSIYLIKKLFNLLLGIEVRDRNNSYSRLLKELNVSFWDI
jgi:hypothetical protein